jgi:Na+-transporting NADH:ubiquinone oxidoreductase subunit NqrB
MQEVIKGLQSRQINGISEIIKILFRGTGRGFLTPFAVGRLFLTINGIF